jgi:virulence factor lipase-like protein/platelet-activating factor acetylhydrolase isoform II
MIRVRASRIAGAFAMSSRFAIALLVTGIALAGCSGSNSDGVGPTDPTSGNGDPGTSTGVGVFHAEFIPLSGVLPYPTDLYFSGSTDGTLNIPATPFMPNAAALNALDGFSTVATATARFSAPIDAATISPATVIMLRVNVDNTTKATLPPVAPLVYGTDYTARVAPTLDSGGQTLEIVPLKPLAPSNGLNNVGYLVILTNGLRDTSGNAATADRDYLAIQGALPSCEALTGTMNLICQLTGAHLQIASAVVPPASVVLTFSFSTQATADTMNIASALTQPTPIGVVQTPFSLSALGIPAAADADIYAGTLQIPYYLDPANPLGGSWHGAPFTFNPQAAPTTFLSRFNPVPVAQATLGIPLLVTVPHGQPKPAGGWPAVIFQHGITGNRAQAVAIAGAYASQGFVVAAIDLPLHGITNDPANNIFLQSLYQGAAERTFKLDLANNDPTGPAGPDGIDDPSGTYFINLPSLLTSRDNLREAAIDIVQLATSLPNLDLDGVAGSDIDASRIHFSAISLGSMVGTVANAMPIATVSAYLNVPGGGIANLLRDSATFSDPINDGLANANAAVVPGSTLYEQFFRDAQTVVDAGDPINYIAAAVAARPVLVTQVLNDQVIPNSATQRLIDAAPFVKTATPGLNFVAAGTGTWVHFTSGFHGSLLSPAASLAVTTEMQTNAASLAASGGIAFAITNPAILEP